MNRSKGWSLISMAESCDVQQQQILEKFRKIVLAEKDLDPCTEDGFLLKFLRTWDFDITKSLALLQNYYKLKFDYSYLFKNFRLSSPKMVALYENNFSTVLTQTDQHGRTVLVTRFGKWDPTRSDFDDIFVALHMILEVIIEDNVQAQFKGVITILDCDGIGLQHAKQMTPANVTRIVTLIEKSFPLWFHAFHYVNENVIFKMILTLIWPFLSKSMRDKIFLHGKNLQSLHKHVIPDILPQEFGGLQPPLDNKHLVEKCFMYEDYVQRMNSFGYKKV